MNLQPLADRVIIEPIENETKTPNGLYLPETSKGVPTRGKIIAAGPGRTSDAGEAIPTVVQTGQTVIFEKFAGTEIKYKGKTYMILRESEIMMVEGKE